MRRALVATLVVLAASALVARAEDCSVAADFCGPKGVCVLESATNASLCYCAEGYWHHPEFDACVEKPPSMAAVISFCTLCVFLAFGKLLRYWLRPLQLLYLPASVIGGLLALVAAQSVKAASRDAYFRIVDRYFIVGWSALPSFLINIVFASLFIGTPLPSVRVIWRQSKHQLVYGFFVDFAQWFVSFFLTAVLFQPVFHVDPAFAVAVPVGFAGGHGTAGGLSNSFKEINYDEGLSLSLAMATVGLLASVLLGVAFVNIAARLGYVREAKMASASSKLQLRGVHDVGARPVAGYLTVSTDSIDALALHLAVIGVAIAAGVGLQQALVYAENEVPYMREYKLLAGIPVFMMSMLTGTALQVILQRFNRKTQVIDKNLMSRLSGMSLDFLVVAAIGTVEVNAIGAAIVPFLIVAVVCTLLQIFFLFVVARWIFAGHHWFENGIAVFGQILGVIASGILLLRMVDPESKTHIIDAFGYRQLLHSPFLGGGLLTALALPAVRSVGLWPMTAVYAVATLACLAASYRLSRSRRRDDGLRVAAGLGDVFSDSDGGGASDGADNPLLSALAMDGHGGHGRGNNDDSSVVDDDNYE